MAEAKENLNVLENIRCPARESLEPFVIRASVRCEVTDDGIQDVEDFEWDEKSYICCIECGREGKIKDFMIKENGDGKGQEETKPESNGAGESVQGQEKDRS
jgi:hypothetical protein